MKNYKESHHVIPISIQGVNWLDNCVTLSKREHEMVHNVLDIPYGLIRRFRKRTNHLLFMDTYYVKELATLQNMYFSRFQYLDEELKMKHLSCMRAMCDRARGEYRVEIDLTPPKATVDVLFKFYLDKYHLILHTMGTYLEKILPPQNHGTGNDR